MKLIDLTELLLARLYEKGNMQPGGIFDADEICREFGETNVINVRDAVEALENRGWVRSSNSMDGSAATITAEGRLFVERGGETGIIPRYQAHPSQFFVITNNSGNIAIGDGNTQSVVKTEDQVSVAKAIEEIRRLLQADASLKPGERSDALQDVATLEAQARKSRPDKSIIESTLANLANVATIAAAVAQFGPTILRLVAGH